MVINPHFWQGKKVLLTGHTGFKGSWLSIWLKKLGVNLVGFSKSISTKPSLFELANVEKDMISIMGDIRDYNYLKEIMSEHKPEIVIHMAAQSLLQESYIDPIETYSTNVMGTVNLLEVARREGHARVIINVTSDKCYENKGLNHSFQENDPMGGYDPYSSSKGCAELVTSSFRNSFFNPTDYKKHGTALASVRAGNVIGGGDWARYRLVPDIMNSILEHRTIKIRNPHATRPWQFVLEPLNGYLLLAEKMWDNQDEYIGAWNFGPNDEDIKPVSWILEKLIELWGNKVNWELDVKNFQYESDFLRLDCTKAKSKLGWTPKTNLLTALRFVIDWYRHYEQKDDLRKTTEEQIKNFNLL